ncbi:hypothetical protein [Polaribacter sp.]|uniref:hypothetical protein n=1 Tax=Polaribacter sp. TaxID=1920175 RepID=UPI0040475055
MGETHNESNRLEIHNSHLIKGAFTKVATNCDIKVTFKYKNRNEALFLEKIYKTNEK